MSPQDLEKCRTLLLASRNSLLSEVTSAVTSEIKEDERYADPCDRASHDQGQAFFFRIKGRASFVQRKTEVRLLRMMASHSSVETRARGFSR